MTFDALAVPDISTLPIEYRTSTCSPLAERLCVALLDSGLAVEADAAETDFSAFATATFSRIWQNITRCLHIFEWRLEIHDNFAVPWGRMHSDRDVSVNATINSYQGPVSCKTLYVGEAMYRLEALRTGFGQTVLAVLYEALGYLPMSMTIGDALSFAEYYQWYGEADEQGAHQNYLDCGGEDCTLDEFLKDHDVLRRAQFFDLVPEWAARPEQVLSRRQIERLGRSDDFARQVIEACDRILNLATHYGPFAPINASNSEPDCVDFGLIVRWSDDDHVYRCLDDHLNELGESGEQLAATGTTFVPTTGLELRAWLDAVRNSAMLAVAVEMLLKLIGASEPATAAQQQEAASRGRNLVQVLA